jgi:hypothetical protein
MMKKWVFILSFICISFSIKAQDITYDLLNSALRENNLLRANMTAQDYNTAGMYFYERKRWTEAEAMFSQAISLDRQHRLARYNLACVISIRLSQISPSQEWYWENEILQETISKGAVFGILYSSVIIFNGSTHILNPERMARARTDTDFDNLRKLDSEFFDAITLPENQRTRYKLTGTYVSFYEGYMNYRFFEFVKLGHEKDDKKDSFSVWDKIFKEMGFCYYSEDYSGFKFNEEMLGKIFELEYIYEVRDSFGEIGGHYKIKFPKVISIKKR